MAGLDVNVELMLKREAQWEVSSYDVAQTETNVEWAEKNLRGIKHENADLMMNDATNIHFAFVRPDRKIMDKCLHELGLDLKQSIERQICLHKTFGGTFVYGERYVGMQRTDKQWKDFVKRAIGQ